MADRYLLASGVTIALRLSALTVVQFGSNRAFEAT